MLAGAMLSEPRCAMRSLQVCSLYTNCAAQLSRESFCTRSDIDVSTICSTVLQPHIGCALLRRRSYCAALRGRVRREPTTRRWGLPFVRDGSAGRSRAAIKPPAGRASRHLSFHQLERQLVGLVRDAAYSTEAVPLAALRRPPRTALPQRHSSREGLLQHWACPPNYIVGRAPPHPTDVS